jgi:hypothetical protein
MPQDSSANHAGLDSSVIGCGLRAQRYMASSPENLAGMICGLLPRKPGCAKSTEKWPEFIEHAVKRPGSTDEPYPSIIRNRAKPRAMMRDSDCAAERHMNSTANLAADVLIRWHIIEHRLPPSATFCVRMRTIWMGSHRGSQGRPRPLCDCVLWHADILKARSWS